jgi:hypothetical protein
MSEMPSPDAAPGDQLLKDRPYHLDEEATRCALQRADRRSPVLRAVYSPVKPYRRAAL